MSDEFLGWPLTKLVTALRRRELGAVEVIAQTIAQIESVDAEVRAFLEVTADRAVEDARRAQGVLDRERDAAPVLTGVPIAVKDLFDVRGLVTTAGSKALPRSAARADSTAWRRLHEAGAVLVGKANTHEFAYGGTTEPTRNPWDLSRIVGGSSGGSAAALASGACFGALGTDTAGSVRIPAALCGVTGFKPANATISKQGVFPLSATLDCVGPLARTPPDTRILFDVLRSSSPTALSSVAPLSTFRGLKVGVVAPQGPIEEGVRQAQLDAIRVLGELGAVIDTLAAAPDLAAAARINFTIMAAEAAQIHRPLLASHGEGYSPYVRARLQEALGTSAADYLDALKARRQTMRAWTSAMEDFDVLLLNGVPCTAPQAYVDRVVIGGDEEDRDWVLCRDTAFANVIGAPVLAVPAGLDAGLPVGIQLVGRRDGTDVLFDVGQAIFECLAAPVPITPISAS